MTTLDGVELGVLCQIAHIDVQIIYANYCHHAFYCNGSNVGSFDDVLCFNGSAILVGCLAVGETCLCIVGAKNVNGVQLVLGYCLFNVIAITCVGSCP